MIGDVPIREQAAAIAAVDSLLYGIEDELSDIKARLYANIDADSATITAALLPSVAKLYAYVDVNLPGDDQAGPLDWSAVQRLNQAVSDGVFEQQHTVALVANRAVESVNQSISNLLPGPGEIIPAIIRVFGNLIDGLLGNLAPTGELWTTLVSTVKASFSEEREGLGTWVGQAGAATLRLVNGNIKYQTELLDRAARTVTTSPTPSSDSVSDYIASIQNQPRIIQNLSNSVLFVLGAWHILSARLAGPASVVQQGSLADVTPTPLSPSQLVDLLRIRAIGEDFAHSHAKRSGTSPELFDLMRKNDERLLDTQPIIELWRRSGDDAVLDELYRLGYSEDSVAALRELALAVATPSDVVRFLVRDVFDDAAIVNGRLDEDFEQKYNEDQFRKAGVSKDLARLYWMAHWSLPSPTQGYHMLHRGLIDIPQLQNLLKLADYAPGWVQHLIDIAYVTPGRVDVRRMYELGIITTDAELEDYYRRMGYSPEHAVVLRDFAKRLKDVADEGKADRRYGRLAGEIVRAFVVGIVSGVQAKDALLQLGFSAERADLRIAEGEYARQRDRANSIRDAIGRQYVRGFLTEEEARAKLAGYAFDEAESNYLLDEWNVQRDLQGETDEKRHQKDLTKSEIIEALRDGLLSREAARLSLVSLGYDEAESDTLLALEDSRAARADAKAIEASAHTQFVKRAIEAVDARAILEGIGYTPTHVAALLSRWAIERESARPSIGAAQLERMLMQGVIPIEQVEERLRQAGYAESDISALLTLYGTDVSIAEEKIREQTRQFEIREARLATQGGRRLDLAERGQDLGQERFNVSQAGLQSRFETTVSQRAELQTERLRSQTALQAERIAASTERDANALAAARERQAASLQAQLDRTTLQLEAASKRAADADATRREALDQRERLAGEARSAADSRQQNQLQAQADRQQRNIDAADRRAEAANRLREGLQERREQFTFELAQLREEATRLRDISQEAARARQLGRTEQVQIRKEQRTAARREITSSESAALESQLQSVQLQKSAAVAEVEARFAALQAQISDSRQADALRRRQEAERALAGATPVGTLLDAGL